MFSLEELIAPFPSLAAAPRELPELEAWFDGGGLGEQAAHAAAFVLERMGVPDIAFAEDEAVHVWDAAHVAGYRELLARLRS